MPEDLPLFLMCMAIGLAIGLALRRLYPPTCQRYAAWAASRIASRRWWVFVFWAAAFLLLAFQAIGLRWYISAAFSVAIAVLELALMTRAIRHRASSAGRSSGE